MMANFPICCSSHCNITNKSTFKEFIDAYCERRNITENQLATISRIDQSELNKITNEHSKNARKNVPIYRLVKICIALGLDEAEAVDLMARRERALSPANPLHDLYRQIIRFYARAVQSTTMQETFKSNPAFYLDYAYSFLVNHGEDDAAELFL